MPKYYKLVILVKDSFIKYWFIYIIKYLKLYYFFINLIIKVLYYHFIKKFEKSIRKFLLHLRQLDN